MSLSFEGNRSRLLAKAFAGAVAGTLAFGVMAGACPQMAHADDDVQAQAQQALDQLNDTLAQEDQATQDYLTAAQNVEQAQSDIDVQNQNISEYQGKLSDRARGMYRSGQNSYLSVLFGSTSFSEFVNNWNFLTKLSQQDADLVSQTKQARDQLQQDEQTYSEQRDAALQKKDDIARQSQQLRDTYNNLSQQVKDQLAQRQDAAVVVASAGGTTNATASADGQAASAQDNTPQYGGVVSDDGTTETVSADAVQSYDASTGTVTLSDGTQAQATYDPSTGSYIVQRAMQFVGGNYGWGSADASTGTFDCSGLVNYVYGWNSGNGDHGGDAESIYENTTQIDASSAQPGDILIWGAGSGNAYHTAIYAGNGMMVSADNPTDGINYEKIWGDPIYMRAN